MNNVSSTLFSFHNIKLVFCVLVQLFTTSREDESFKCDSRKFVLLETVIWTYIINYWHCYILVCYQQQRHILLKILQGPLDFNMKSEFSFSNFVH